ncbi:hypothetical protein [Blastococcus sp. CCUG 61487]|uniref:hypothetical protein n=1 Tax=Blastococcus sp. CCUG 61487 TaxID=1840703 RepID=UPI0010BFED2E|nr:hypothetical protein [Blastococcus sp. CCUG 61487]TKJ25214.1 hypothetical protein A6V29_04115 [Blastococcus sp. CCUG 61487]
MAWMWTPEAERARTARGGHTVATKVDILHGGSWAYTLKAIGGEVSASAGSSVRASVGCTLVDPTGTLGKGDVGDLLNADECEIAPYRGVVFGPPRRREREYAPLGVFGLTSHELDDTPDGLTIRLTGQDRALIYQGQMLNALTVRAGTPIEVAIRMLLAARNPTVTLLAMRTGFTCGPLLYPSTTNVWDAARELAASVGGILFHDRTGQAVFAMSGPQSDAPVAMYAEGTGRLGKVTKKIDTDTIFNVVIAESPDGRIRAVAQDLDPTSRTYARGRYGPRPAPTLVNQHFHSVDQAMQAAVARLDYELGRTETATFTGPPDAGQYVDEAVVLHRPASGFHYRGVVVDELDMPLEVGDGDGAEMTVRCRSSRLARDGRMFPIEEVAA